MDKLDKIIKECIQEAYEREWTDNDDPLIWEFMEEYGARYIFENFKEDSSINNMWMPLINPYEYKQALTEFTKYGQLYRFPKDRVYKWMGLCLKNIALLKATTEIYGHSMYAPIDDFVDAFFDYDFDSWKEWCDEHGTDDDWGGMSKYLDEQGFYEWSDSGTQTPPYSDYGLEPLEKLAQEYTEDMDAEEVLILINRILDVVHCRGDLSMLFMKGGQKSLWQISNK